MGVTWNTTDRRFQPQQAWTSYINHVAKEYRNAQHQNFASSVRACLARDHAAELVVDRGFFVAIQFPDQERLMEFVMRWG